jgi:hypothetical protein
MLVVQTLRASGIEARASIEAASCTDAKLRLFGLQLATSACGLKILVYAALSS